MSLDLSTYQFSLLALFQNGFFQYPLYQKLSSICQSFRALRYFKMLYILSEKSLFTVSHTLSWCNSKLTSYNNNNFFFFFFNMCKLSNIISHLQYFFFYYYFFKICLLRLFCFYLMQLESICKCNFHIEIIIYI